MTTRRTLMATAFLASLCGALHGQTGEKTANFQYFVNGDPTVSRMALRVEGLGKTVTGKPFSATEERQTVQVLGDGTRIDKKETDRYFRDAQGRTRIERDNGNTIVISDPVAGFTTEMSAANKTAHKTMVMMRSGGAGVAGQPNIVMMDKLKAEIAAARPVAGVAAVQSQEMVFARTEEGAHMSAEAKSAAAEDLGTQIINGVPAQGTRSTITIPAGEIGNDREIKIVSERWYSSDLQMLMKSSNNDPRFGETTYQLTNVLQGAQDPTLFQIPADFSVNGLR
jgi:hypothetical protein